jgi:hypothetical protein
MNGNFKFQHLPFIYLPILRRNRTPAALSRQAQALTAQALILRHRSELDRNGRLVHKVSEKIKLKSEIATHAVPVPARAGR